MTASLELMRRTDGRTTDGMEDKPMDGEDGRMLLRKRDLVNALGVAKSTVADWVSEFNVFIPTIQDGALTLYKREALENWCISP